MSTAFSAPSREVVAKAVISMPTGDYTSTIDTSMISMTIELCSEESTEYLQGSVLANAVSITLIDKDVFNSESTTAAALLGSTLTVTLTSTGGGDSSVSTLSGLVFSTLSISDYEVTTLNFIGTLSDAASNPDALNLYMLDTNANDAMQAICDAIGLVYVPNSQVALDIPYFYSMTSLADTLKSLLVATSCVLIQNFDGSVQLVQHWLARGSSVERISDSDQIFSVAKPTTCLTYDSVSLNYGLVLGTSYQTVLDEKYASFVDGHVIRDATVKDYQVIGVRALGLNSNVPYNVESLTSTSNSVSVDISTTSDDANAQLQNLRVVCTVMQIQDSGATAISERDSSNTLDVTSVYIQSVADANELTERLLSILVNDMGMYEVSTRGDFTLPIMSIVHVQSDLYNLDFFGQVYGINYSYTGGLSSTVSIRRIALDAIQQVLPFELGAYDAL